MLFYLLLYVSLISLVNSAFDSGYIQSISSITFLSSDLRHDITLKNALKWAKTQGNSGKIFCNTLDQRSYLDVAKCNVRPSSLVFSG